MTCVINDIGYTNTEGTRTVLLVSLMTYDMLTLTELGEHDGCH